MIVHEEILPAGLAALANARKLIRRMLDDLRFSEELKSDIEIVISEAGTNAIRHGNPSPSIIKILVTANSRGVEVMIADNGGRFEAFDENLRACHGMPDLMAESGRGLSLLKLSTDRIGYESCDGWNRLTLFRRHVRSRLKILVAEDSEATLAMFVAMLGQKYDVITARSVREMKARLGSDIGLLITDLHLGDGKASDFLTTLEATREGFQIPVLLVTSDTSDHVVSDAVSMGIETVLAKPVRAKTLLEAVDKSMAARARQRLNEARHFNQILDEIVGKPDFSDVAGFNLAWQMGTAGSGGGDLLVDLGGTGRRRIALADLMGHGVSARARSATWAGLLMGVQSGLESAGPHEFVNRFSTALRRADMPEHVSGTLLVIDLLDDGSLELASAGHPAPLLFSENEFTDLKLDGKMPGVVDIVCEAPLQMRLAPGERLIAATDGIDPQGLAYRLDLPPKARKAALEACERPVVEMVRAMAKAVDEISGYRPDDDWTLLVIEAAAGRP